MPAKKTTTTKKDDAVKKSAPAKKTETKEKTLHNWFSGNYFYANGKRKTSIAKVRLYEKGNGEIIVNGKELSKYFVGGLGEIVKSPLLLTGNDKNFNITIKVIGGGLSSQAGAARHGIAKALMVFEAELKASLKKEGHITRDARIKERKKPGLKRARKAPTWVKR